MLQAQTGGGVWLERIEQRASELTYFAVELLVEAHRTSEEAEGVARAVKIARRSETWAPVERQRNIDEMFG